MASFINTNMVSLNTQNNLSKSQDALAQSIKRLSTGLRINSAKDDAAGLAISNRMDATIRGQTVAIRNTNDAVSFSQTADGALAQINNNLQRLRELAVQASNGTNSAGDRELLNTEFNQLQQEVVRIQNNTAFNGTNAMQDVSVTVQIGAGTTQYDKIQINGIDLTRVTAATETDKVVSNTFTRATFDVALAAIKKSNPTRAANIFFNESNGHVYEKVTDKKSLTAANENAISKGFGGQTGYLAKADAAEKTFILHKAANMGSVWLNGAATGSGNAIMGNAMKAGSSNKVATNVSINLASIVEYGGAATVESAATNLVQTFGAGTATMAVFQVNDADDLSVSTGMLDSSGTQIELYKTIATGVVTTASSGTLTTANKVIAGQIFYAKTTGTAYSSASSYASITGAHIVTTDSEKADSSDLAVFGNVSGVNILTQADALSAIDSLDKAMLQVNVAQIQQGATQNRLSAIINTLTNSNESTTNARSHIMDTDFAAETASMARAQILQQAGMAMLAQANTSNNGIMALMR